MNGFAGDVSYEYPFDIVLAASDNLPNEGIRTDTDSDFLLLGLVLNSFTSILFSLQFKDSSGNYFSSGPILAANYAAQGPLPYVFPGRPRIFPPGSSLGIAIKELSAAQNTIQLSFVGEKRFVPARPVCGPDALTNRLLVRS